VVELAPVDPVRSLVAWLSAVVVSGPVGAAVSPVFIAVSDVVTRLVRPERLREGVLPGVADSAVALAPVATEGVWAVAAQASTKKVASAANRRCMARAIR
jgi:hypothetical protein